ncbi:sulfite exporter TauE/SafE family protein [Sphingobacterium sp. HJSM2_6]|uniref:sulfite exporter TauE/SafE family protein n=1 Tax=Sphingobacterium sp. HJSM2_6 TaxID=3366264 RepID=UPI003BBC4865
MEKYVVFLVLALITEVIGTVSGFGSSILFVPTASLFFSFKTVLGITAVFHVFSNLSKIALFRNGINKGIAIKLGIPAVIFVSLGALLTNYIPLEEMELGMNILIFCLAIFLLFRFNKPLAQSNRNLYVGGILSGFFAGLVGTGGAIRGITLAAFNLPKDVFIATSSLIDLGVDLSRAIIYVSQGYFPKEFIGLIPFLILISLFGSYLGKLILLKTSEKVFKYLVLAVILATSIVQFINYFQK